MEVFEQILELDDDDDFVQEMIDGYLSQAEDTFKNMDNALCALAPYLLSRHAH